MAQPDGRVMTRAYSFSCLILLATSLAPAYHNMHYAMLSIGVHPIPLLKYNVLLTSK